MPSTTLELNLHENVHKRPLKDILNIPSYGLMVEQDDGHQDKTFTPDIVLGHGDVIDCEEYKIEVNELS